MREVEGACIHGTSVDSAVSTDRAKASDAGGEQDVSRMEPLQQPHQPYAPAAFHHPGSCFQHRALKTAQVPSVWRSAFHFTSKDGEQVIGQERQEKQGFVFRKGGQRETGGDRMVEFAEPILESATVTVVFQQLIRLLLLFFSIRYEKEIVGHQL